MPRGSSVTGAPIGSGFSALIFFGSFLYQDKKEHLVGSSSKFCHGDATVLHGFFEKPLLAPPTHPWSPISPVLCSGLGYFAPSGLSFTHSPGFSFLNYSAPSGLVKIVRSTQGAAPLATYFAPSGLKSAGRRTSSIRLPTSFAGSRASSGILNPPVGGQVLESARWRTSSRILNPSGAGQVYIILYSCFEWRPGRQGQWLLQLPAQPEPLGLCRCHGVL